MKTFIFVCLLTLHVTALSETIRMFNITLPQGTKSIEPNRFLSPRSYDETKKVFQTILARSTTLKRMGDEINLPNVRAIFYKNIEKNSSFYGINIYLNVQTGLTEIFFLVI